MGHESMNPGDCHTVEVRLALSAVFVNKPSDSRFCVGRELYSLPNRILRTGQKSLEVAEDLFRELTGATPTWLPIQQVGTLDGRGDGLIIILYAVNMPNLVPLLDESVQWIDFETMGLYPELLRMVGFACNAYKIGTTL